MCRIQLFTWFDSGYLFVSVWSQISHTFHVKVDVALRVACRSQLDHVPAVGQHSPSSLRSSRQWFTIAWAAWYLMKKSQQSWVRIPCQFLACLRQERLPVVCMVTSDWEEINFWIVWVSATWQAPRCRFASFTAPHVVRTTGASAPDVARAAGRWYFVGACSWSGGLAHRQVALWLSLMVMRAILAAWRESVAVSGALHTGAGPYTAFAWTDTRMFLTRLHHHHHNHLSHMHREQHGGFSLSGSLGSTTRSTVRNTKAKMTRKSEKHLEVCSQDLNAVIGCPPWVRS